MSYDIELLFTNVVIAYIIKCILSMNFTDGVNPSKFFDTSIKNAETFVYKKPNKVPIHWTSKVPKRYKRNAENGDLSRSNQISMNFDQEEETVRENYRVLGSPTRFVNNFIRQFYQ